MYNLIEHLQNISKILEEQHKCITEASAIIKDMKAQGKRE